MSERMTFGAGMLTLSIAFSLAAASLPAPSMSAGAVVKDCSTFQRWFTQQPGAQLVLRSTNDVYAKSPRPRKADTILDYSAFPLSHDRASWYKSMKHFSNNVGNGRCLSGSYDSTRKTGLVYAQYGTASDLTLTSVSSVPNGLSIHSAPNETANGVRLGMTVAQVVAIDGPGNLRTVGRYQRLSYNQDFTAPANVRVIAYLGFLFANGNLVAMNVGGGV